HTRVRAAELGEYGRRPPATRPHVQDAHALEGLEQGEHPRHRGGLRIGLTEADREGLVALVLVHDVRGEEAATILCPHRAEYRVVRHRVRLPSRLRSEEHTSELQSR